MAAGIDKFRNGYRSRFTVNGKRYAVTGKTISECRQKEAKKRQEIEEGLSKECKKQPFSEYAQEWIDAKQGEVKDATIYFYNKVLKTVQAVPVDWNGKTFGEIKMGDIKEEHIRIIRSKLVEKMNTNSVNQCVSFLRAVFKTAVNKRQLLANPTACIKPLRRVEEPARDNIHRALTKAETARFFETASARNSWFFNLYQFLLNTGCRVGEAGTITSWDIKRGSVQISRTLTKGIDGSQFVGKDTKTRKGTRSIPLTEPALDALEKQRELNARLYGDKAQGMPIFTGFHGQYIRVSTINRDIEAICRAAGIERFTVHAFRDTFATRSAEDGMLPNVLMDILGHSDINMTLGLYAHAMEDTKAEQIRAVKFA